MTMTLRERQYNAGEKPPQKKKEKKQKKKKGKLLGAN